MNVTKIPADVLFRVFTACEGEVKTLILDVRPLKEFKKQHIADSYSIRLAANGETLLDYSKNQYDWAWSNHCWWDKHIVLYGEEKLKRDHPVAAFLAKDNHAKSVNVYPDGFKNFEKLYPFLVTTSLRSSSSRRYPGEIIPGLLYLGDWAHASNFENLDHLKIRRIITVHNNPENLKPPSKYRHLQMPLADVETEDISQFFDATFTCIEEAKSAREGVLVHCGAGVSRSASLCIAYLMRKFNWPASKARAHCVQRRSIVMPNDGFWRALCAFETQLGIQQRSDPAAVSGFSGADAPVKIAENAAGEKVTVNFVSMAKVREEEAASKAQEVSKEAAWKTQTTEKVANAAVPGNALEEADGKPVSNPDRQNGAAVLDASTQAEETAGGRGSARHEVDGEDRGGRKGDRREISRDGREREREHSRDRAKERDRGRDRGGHGRERRDMRSRSRSRDRSRERRSDGRSKDRESGRHGQVRAGEKRRSPDQRREIPLRVEKPKSEPVPPEFPARPPATVVLESIKEGKAIGRLEIGLKSRHQRCIFGRLPSNEVVLEHLSISRQHAQLTTDEAGELLITDLGSAHRTNVNGIWIRPNQARPIPVGTVFKLGGSTREFKVVMTPKERKRLDAKSKAAADLEEAKQNTESY